MNSSELINQLRSLSDELNKALEKRDINLVKRLDGARYELIKQFAEVEEQPADKEIISSLEVVSEEIANCVSRIKFEMDQLSKKANSHIRVLTGYQPR